MNLPAAYTPARHPAPCDLDLSGAETHIASASERYPDSSGLQAALASRFGVSADRVLITAGADDALDRACRAALAPGRNALFTDPTFEMVPRYVALSGAEARTVAWSGGDLPAEALVARADPSTALAFVVTPNNPTGLVASVGAVRRLHDALPHAVIVVDLAYVEFADRDPTAELLTLERIVVVRTLSKAWGRPGLRIGFAIGSAESIARLRRAGGPFPVAAESIRAAVHLLESGDAHMRASVAAIRANRSRLRRQLEGLGAEVTESQGNFVCVAGPRASWLRDALAGLGIATRLLDGGGRSWLRISVPADVAPCDRLMTAVRASLAPDAVLFDLDGVIADVSRSYREAIRLTAARFGVELTAGQIAKRKAAGNANDDWALTAELIRAAGVPCELPNVTEVFEELYQGGLCELETCLVSPSLLSSRLPDLSAAVVTGRPRADVDRFLARYDLRDSFKAVVAREDAPLKPSPEPVRLAMHRIGARTAWMIGDTPDDIASARDAGAVPIGIASDAATIDALYRAGAARVVATATEVLAWLP